MRRFDKETAAFVLKLNTKNDSIFIGINKGGIGDGPDIIDSTTTLKGVCKMNGKYLMIKGVQRKDTLDLICEIKSMKPKKGFW